MDCNYVTFRTLSNFPLDNGFDSYPIGICTHGKQFECIKDTNTSKWTVEYKLSPKGDFQCYQKDMANNLTLVESMMGPHGSTVEDLECAQSNPCDSVWFLDYTWEPKTPDPKPQKKWTVNGLCEKTTVGKAKSQRITCSKKELSIPLIERWNEDRLVIEYFRFERTVNIISKSRLCMSMFVDIMICCSVILNARVSLTRKLWRSEIISHRIILEAREGGGRPAPESTRISTSVQANSTRNGGSPIGYMAFLRWLYSFSFLLYISVSHGGVNWGGHRNRHSIRDKDSNKYRQ